MFQQREPSGISAKTTDCNSNGSGRSGRLLSSTAAAETRNLLHRLTLLFSALLCLGLLAATPPASAHVRIGSVSHAVATAKGDTLTYYMNLPPVVLKLLHENIGDATSDLTDYFGTELRVSTWDSSCPLRHVNSSPPLASGNRIFALQFQCPRPIADLTIRSILFLDLDGGHTQFTRLVSPADPRKILHEAVLSESNSVFHVADVKTGGSVSLERALAFLKLGVMHLLTGYDHILFLLTVVVGISFMESLKAVTSFTLAHSRTMALAPRVLVVEDQALIALALTADLAALGCVVVGRTVSGEDALAVARREMPDLVMLVDTITPI